MVIAINVCWHTYRAWFPKYLQQKRGFSETDMSAFMTWFYLTADIGSWTIGLLSLVMVRRGMSNHMARLLVMAGCAGMVLVSFAIPFLPVGWQLTASVLIFAFGALGLFPTYFALSQELSAAHQGKVSGTLGAGAHIFLALVAYRIQGQVIKDTGSYDEVLAVAGLFPLLSFGLMMWLWPLNYVPPSYEPPTPAVTDVDE